MTPGLLHLEPEVGALTGSLPDAGEDRHAAVLLGDPVDHLLDEHGLADAGAAEQADLAALHVGLEEVDDLDAGLEHLPLGLERVERRRRSRWISHHASGSPISPASSGSPITLKTWPSTPSPTGTVMPRPVLTHRGPPGEPVGRLQADAAHPALADLLGDLGGDDDLLVVDHELHLERRC